MHGLENHNNEFLLDQSQHQSSSRRSLLTSVGTTQKRTWITVSLKKSAGKEIASDLVVMNLRFGCIQDLKISIAIISNEYHVQTRCAASASLPIWSNESSATNKYTWLTWHLPKKVSPTHQLTSNQSLNTCNGGAQFIHGRFSTGHDLRLQSGEVTTLGPWELPPEREQVVKNCILSDFCWFLGKLGQQYFLNLFKSAEIFIGPPGLMIIQQE